MAGETSSLYTNEPLPVSKTAKGLIAYYKTAEIATTQLETNDLTQISRLPPGAVLVGAILKTDDLDSNGSEALVWTLQVGDTAYKAGITNATAFAGTFIAGAPITTTTETAVYLKSTTAAATGAAGTVDLTLLYYTTA